MRFTWLLLLISLFSCQQPTNTPAQEAVVALENPPPIEIVKFPRDEVKAKLQKKIAAKEPLLVHVFVPLCDNKNQGIVPVSAELGNGRSLKTNLYWGALYGVKTHFRKRGWVPVKTDALEYTEILERVVYKKDVGNTTVYLMADAYAGDHMQTCLIDYFDAIAQKRNKAFEIEGANLNQADLVVFNGHNGLMDMNVEPVVQQKDTPVDAAVIACAYNNYFNQKLMSAGGYPILTTTNLMAPEGYVLEALVTSWALQKDGPAIRSEVAKAYNKYQKCGERGALRLFQSGWE